MEIILTIVGVVLGIGVIAYFASSKFRQAARIKGNQAVDSMTTAVERQEDDYKQLLAKLPDQRRAVSRVMGNSEKADRDLTAAEKKVADLQGEYADAKASNAPSSVLDTLAEQWQAAKDDVDVKREIAELADQAEQEARAALDATTKALQKFKTQVQQGKAKAELTKALEVSAEASEQSKAMRENIGRASKATQEIDAALDEARARNELTKGTKEEQELADYREKKAAKDARGALDALVGGDAPAAPAADTTDGADS